jgi:hypothetical protein
MPMTLTLNDEELGLLTAVLEQDLHGLEVEINHTDDRAFKADLEHRAAVLRGVVERLGGGKSPG